MKKTVRDYLWIVFGSALYALAITLFLFPHDLVLGGTSGLSVILGRFLPLAEGDLLAILNMLLLVLAFLILGRQIAVRTLVGSTLTGLFASLFERIFTTETALIGAPALSAIAGAALIAVASAILFAVASSSGGTDVVALILRKFSSINIGRALLITDVLIVIAGGFLSGYIVLLYSAVGLVIKTLGIDGVTALYLRLSRKAPKGEAPAGKAPAGERSAEEAPLLTK